MKKILSIFYVFLLLSCLSSMSIKKEDELIFKLKGYGDKTMKRLEPVIFQLDKPINGVVGIDKEDFFVTLNRNGEFALAELFDNGKLQVKAIVDKFPYFDGDYIKSDSENNVVWMVRGRGLYFLDIDSKKTGHCVASKDGNDEVQNSFLVDPEKKIFLIQIRQLTPIDGFYYVLYDLNKDEIIFTSDVYQGVPGLFSKDTMLFDEFLGGPLRKWWMIDLNMKEKKENKLTKELNKYKMTIWPRTKTINKKRKMMLGVTGIEINGDYQYMSIKWDDEFEKIKIEPILLQLPSTKYIDSAFEFSPDSNWVKSLKLQQGDDSYNFPPELIIFQVADVYPQSLSMPIYCGYTKENNPGAFVNHSTMGPCYVEWDPEFPKKLFVYKLNDGLKLMASPAL